MGDLSEAPSSLFEETVYFADDPWEPSSPWHGDGSPPASVFSGNTAQERSYNNHNQSPPPLHLNIHERLENPPPNNRFAVHPSHLSPHTWTERTPSPQVIPEEIVFPPPSTPSDVSWNVLLSSDSESHNPPMNSQRSLRSSRRSTRPTSQRDPARQTASDVVDLTQDTSTPPRTRRPSSSSQQGSNKRRRIHQDVSTQPLRRNQRRRGEQQEDMPPEVEEVDLRDVDDDQGLLKVLEDQRMATIKSQQEQASKPVKLATLSCVICMDLMTDVTATACGK